LDKLYTVTLRFQHPAWDEREGLPYEVTAANKKEAVRIARSRAEHDGHLPCSGKGLHWLKAEQENET